MLAIRIGDLAGADLLLDAALQLRPDPVQEALAVAQALVLRVQAAVDEDRHGRLPAGTLTLASASSENRTPLFGPTL